MVRSPEHPDLQLLPAKQVEQKTESLSLARQPAYRQGPRCGKPSPDGAGTANSREAFDDKNLEETSKISEKAFIDISEPEEAIC